MTKQKSKKSLGHTVWFKSILTIMIMIPPVSQIPYNSADSTKVIAAVMSHPLSDSITYLLPAAKLLLLVIAVLPFFLRFSEKIVLGYYFPILLIVGVFQNIAQTQQYGVVWLSGNTAIQFTVACFCIFDIIRHRTKINPNFLHIKRLWVIPLMLLALLMPYSADAGNVVHPSLTFSVFTNESGLTYCMLTPVVIGILLLFSKGVSKPLLSVISYVGFLFGLLNMATWFCMQAQNWWMGVLHLPLLILSFYGLVVAHRERAQTMAAQ